MRAWIQLQCMIFHLRQKISYIINSSSCFFKAGGIIMIDHALLQFSPKQHRYTHFDLLVINPDVLTRLIVAGKDNDVVMSCRIQWGTGTPAGNKESCWWTPDFQRRRRPEPWTNKRTNWFTGSCLSLSVRDHSVWINESFTQNAWAPSCRSIEWQIESKRIFEEVVTSSSSSISIFHSPHNCCMILLIREP